MEEIEPGQPGNKYQALMSNRLLGCSSWLAGESWLNTDCGLPRDVTRIPPSLERLLTYANERQNLFHSQNLLDFTLMRPKIGSASSSVSHADGTLMIPNGLDKQNNLSIQRTDRLPDQLTNGHTNWPTTRPTDQPTDTPINYPTDRPTDRPTVLRWYII